MPLKAQIQDDMIAALKAGERLRLTTVRMLISAVKLKEIDDRTEVDDAQVIAITEKLIKQRRESAAQYRDAGRDELVNQEEAEIEILKVYLPEPLSESDLDALIESAVSGSGASSLRDMGQVMNLIKKEARGRADMGKVSERVKARLAQGNSA